MRRVLAFKWLPTEVMNPALIRPFFDCGRQSRPNRILPDVLPFFGITFRVTQPMVKSPALKFFRLGTFLGQLVLPKRKPPFDGDIFTNGRRFSGEVVGVPSGVGRDALPVVRCADTRANGVPSSRRTEQVQVIRHQKIIANQPHGGMTQPDVV